jgi:hypothetical protein
VHVINGWMKSSSHARSKHDHFRWRMHMLRSTTHCTLWNVPQLLQKGRSHHALYVLSLLYSWSTFMYLHFCTCINLHYSFRKINLYYYCVITLVLTSCN